MEIKTVNAIEHWKKNNIDYLKVYKEFFTYSCSILLHDIALSENGPWLSGGSARKMFFGAELDTDIDIFFKDQLQYSLLDAKLKAKSINSYSKEMEYLRKSTHASNYKIYDKKVQLINFEFHNSIEDLFKTFDFTICHFAYDGKTLYYTDQAIEDSKEMKLRINDIRKPVHCIRRIIKYIKQGYDLDSFDTKEFFEKVKISAENNSDENVKTYNIDISWTGMINEDQIEHICRHSGVDPREIRYSTDSYDYFTVIVFYSSEDKNLFRIAASSLYPDLKEKPCEV